MAGPLQGLKVIEMAGLGPVTFAAMLLADMGAEVLRIERPGEPSPSPRDPTHRGRAGRLTLDLKQPEAVARFKALAARADILMEGFRPGVMERLGLGPADLSERLIYGRMTGWGQSGPLAQAAGHDINYIALSGVLAAMGEPGAPPRPPLNLVGDYGGGSLYLILGVLAALYERQRSGKGQVIDAAVVDGSASLMALFCWMQADGVGRAEAGKNLLDGSAPFYGTYACADGLHVSVGPLEPKFWAVLAEALELPAHAPSPGDASRWPELRRLMEAAFARRPRAEWVQRLEGTDACFAPVLTLEAAAAHPHLAGRETFNRNGGVLQPSAAPRLSRTPGAAGPLPGAEVDGMVIERRWLGA
ncbi:CaiB/BaiF CoA-transferase family protein [Brevundimonas sp. 2R-24]|uniref:CaiB/BaiF CoA-transferase family protein n=1 Tax=Peiella sedimenti TaxID=3061083 RepID=A0ABT8SIU4_9CAUL|nr:CaiB/BaiF CoA-transferase family protein [Caulobacteraceae bacterium XZ-24]